MSGGTADYSPRVRALFDALPRAGAMPGSGRVIVGEAVAIDRGAWVRLEARLEDGRIADCRFLAWGCPHTLAAASLAAAELAAGTGAPGARHLARELDVPAGKMGRLLVVEDAIQALLAEQARVQ
jgi:NifU-like protein involved in Fe-S cluster formation